MEIFFFTLYVCDNKHITESLLEIDGEIIRTIYFLLSNYGYLDSNLNSFSLVPNLGILSYVFPSQEAAEWSTWCE